MAQRSKEQQHHDEEKVLDELQRNAKENLETIAEHCGFSRQKTCRIIKELQASKRIWGYSAILDTEKQGVQKFMLFFKRSNKPFSPDEVDEIAQTRLDTMKKNLGITVLSSYRIHGEYDWVTIFTAKDIMSAKKFSEGLMNKFSGAQTLHMSQVLFTVREHCIENPNVTDLKNHL